LPGIWCGEYADLPGELDDLGAIRVTDDPVPVTTSSTRPLSQFCRDPRGDVVEVGPASPEQRDLSLALGLAHRLLFRPRRPGRETVEVRHARALDAFDDLHLSGRNELIREPGKLGHLGVSGLVHLEDHKGVIFGLATPIPAGPVERGGDRLLLAMLNHHPNR